MREPAFSVNVDVYICSLVWTNKNGRGRTEVPYKSWSLVEEMFQFTGIILREYIRSKSFL
jgi:hypothetical protein